MTAAKVMDVIARLLDCDGQAADAVSACTRERLEGRSQIAQNSEVRGPDGWIRLPRHKWPKSGPTLKIPWCLLSELYMDTNQQDCCGEDKSKKFYWNLDGKPMLKKLMKKR